MESRIVSVNGVQLNVLFHGPQTGKPLILLHGFPESAELMMDAFKRLTSDGYYLVAPDQRGYLKSSRPDEVEEYKLEKLSGDIQSLIRELKLERCSLLGHDWGGVVAWHLAAQAPELISDLIILNAPHFAVFKKELLKNPKQILRSSYIFLFILPKIAELILSAKDFFVPKQGMIKTEHPKLDLLEKGWKQTGTLTGMLNWYRALMMSTEKVSSKITVPTKIIWGKQDSALGPELAEASLKCCEDGSLTFIEGATHWVHHQKKSEVRDLILAQLKSN
jgi:pimeloyl-ACP methyl ester carboxylesterase